MVVGIFQRVRMCVFMTFGKFFEEVFVSVFFFVHFFHLSLIYFEGFENVVVMAVD